MLIFIVTDSDASDKSSEESGKDCDDLEDETKKCLIIKFY